MNTKIMLIFIQRKIETTIPTFLVVTWLELQHAKFSTVKRQIVI